jgi:hypothetical protein
MRPVLFVFAIFFFAWLFGTYIYAPGTFHALTTWLFVR